VGWIPATLGYREPAPIHRQFHHHDMTFSMVYAYNENFMLPLSHDEVVHLKRSLLEKMPGDKWRRFANLRAYYAFMWTHPGKKLLFMGSEFAQLREWNHENSLDWHLLGQKEHAGVQNLIRDLNHLYKNTPALYEMDCEPGGFRWLRADEDTESYYAFLRFDRNQKPVLVLSNFTPVPRYNYTFGVPKAGRWVERVNTDHNEYGGSGIGQVDDLHTRAEAKDGFDQSLSLNLPPLATVILEFAS